MRAGARRRGLHLADGTDEVVAGGAGRCGGHLFDHREAGGESAEEAGTALRETTVVDGVTDRGGRWAAVHVVVAAHRVHERAARPGEALAGKAELAAAGGTRLAGDVRTALHRRRRTRGRRAWGTCMRRPVNGPRSTHA